MYRYSWLLFVLSILSCSEPDSQAESGYFNAMKYFSAEAARLEALDDSVFKTTAWNGKASSSPVEIMDWRKELEPFSKCSIHQSSMRNSYKVDSAFRDGITSTTYTALESRLPVRFLEVQSGAGGVERMTVLTGDTNTVFAIRRQLSYIADSGYVIRGWQAMKMTAPSEYFIRVAWK